MKILECQQGSMAWEHARLGIPTASEFGNILKLDGTLRDSTSEMANSYKCTKLAEWWRGEPLPGFSSFATEQGTLREERAIPFFELKTGQSVERVGFITTDDGKIGASPDGLLANDGGGLECKCLQPQNHVKLLLNGGLPKEHKMQVMGGMLVTGLHNWTFLSFCPGFPPLIVRVEWDQELIMTMMDSLSIFCNDMEQAKQYLIDLNGGEPKRSSAKLSGERPKHSWEMDHNDVPVP